MDTDQAITYPTHTLPLHHQIAGHRHGQGKTKLGMLLHKDGSVLKPLVHNDKRAIREQQFYKQVTHHADTCKANPSEADGKCEDKVLHDLIALMPRYLGEFQSDYVVPGTDHPPVKYIKIVDLVQGFELPCISDIKIGRVTYGPDATEKKKQEQSKYAPQKEVGYRILGMKIYENGNSKMYGSDYGLSLTKDTIAQGIKKFVSANPSVVPLIVEQLNDIYRWFSSQKRFGFYGSSILFVYEAMKKHAVVRLIDFAHVHEAKEPVLDENYLFGLKNLIKDFKACLPANVGPPRAVRRSVELDSTKVSCEINLKYRRHSR